MVRSINVTADLLEVTLAADECPPSSEGGAPQPKAAGEQPGWDRLMGINSFSIERALQVRGRGCVRMLACTGRVCDGSVVAGWTVGWLLRGWAGSLGGVMGEPAATPAPTQPPADPLQVDPYFMDSDSEGEEGDPSPSKQQQPDAPRLPAITAAAVAANLAPAEPGPRGSKRAREEGPSSNGAAAAAVAEIGECGAHPGPCTEQCTDLEADELLRKQKLAAAQAQDAAQTAAAEAALAAAAAAQRQPKRRRKKLHDLSGVGSVGITARGALDKYRFNMFMGDLLGEKARDIFRSKGVLCIKVGAGCGWACWGCLLVCVNAVGVCESACAPEPLPPTRPPDPTFTHTHTHHPHPFPVLLPCRARRPPSLCSRVCTRPSASDPPPPAGRRASSRSTRLCSSGATWTARWVWPSLLV